MAADPEPPRRRGHGPGHDRTRARPHRVRRRRRPRAGHDLLVPLHAPAACDSPVGRTRTLPDGPVDVLRIGTVCCAHYSSRRSACTGRSPSARSTSSSTSATTSTRTTATTGPDRTTRRTPPPRSTTTGAASPRSGPTPTPRRCTCATRWSPIWDDHDLADNAWRDGAKDHDPDEHGPWPERVAAAAAARQEWLPARLRDPERPAGRRGGRCRSATWPSWCCSTPAARPRPPGR